MNAQLQEIFDSVPEDKPRSRLEPYRDLILRWKRQGRSYRRIRDLVAEHCNVAVSTIMIRKFVISRSRPRKEEPEAELVPEPVMRPRLSHEEKVARAKEFRAAYDNQPAPKTKKRLFEFDEGTIITNSNYKGIEQNGNGTTNS